MAGAPISNIYIVNDDGIYDPSALRNLSSILNVPLGSLESCSIQVSSHAQNQGLGQSGQSGFIDIHQQQADRRRQKQEEKERKKREEEEKKRKLEALKLKFPYLDEKVLDDWRSVFHKNTKTEETVFFKTKGYEEVRRTLDFHHVVIIFGYPGEGKTSCSKYLGEDYNSHMSKTGPRYEILNISTPWEFKQKVNPKKFQMIIVDDIFGTHSINLEKVEMWADYLDMMFFTVKSVGSKLRLVITCGRHLYEKARQFLHDRVIFQENLIVDISADGIGMKPQERQDLLRNNVGYLSYKDSSSMMAYSSYSGFPLCCRLFGICRTFQNLGRSFFNDPSKYIPQEIEKVAHFDKTVYGILVTAALNGGYINLMGRDMTNLDQRTWSILKKVLTALKAPVDDLEVWILQDAGKLLSGVFLFPIQDDSYRMVHHRVTEHVLKQFSHGNGLVIVEAANAEMFMEFVKSGQYYEGLHEKCFNAYPTHYDKLAERFVFDILQGNIRTASSHQAFLEEKFVTHFFEYLDKQGNLEAVYRARDDTGNSFLFWAAWYGRDHVVKQFVEKESLTRMADDGLGIGEQRALTLLAACYRGGVTEIKNNRYKPKDAPPEVKPIVALSALIKAGVPITATASMEKAEEAVNFEFRLMLESKATAIHFAALGNNPDAMKLILDNGGDVTAKTEMGEVPLHLAATRSNPDVVKHLLDAGADVNAKTSLGKTAIHDAVNYKRTEIAKLLLEKGADVNIPSEDERSLLQVAVANTDSEMVKVLIEKGAKVNKKGRDGWTALHEAFYLGDTQSAEVLLEKGADPYIYTSGGVAPLHEAVSNCDRDLIDILLETGVSVNKSSSSGETPLHVAAKNGNLDLVKKLLDMGADLDARDGTGMLPLNAAAASSHSEVMHYLLERSGMKVPKPPKRDAYGRYIDEDEDDEYGPYAHMPRMMRMHLMRERRMRDYP